MANTVSKTLSDDTLNRIIQIESAGKVAAANPNSSATGLFQFISTTWLGVVEKHRPDLLEGRTRAQVLALRTDAKIAIELGARFTEDNAKALGPGFSDGDLYLAHFFGIVAAKKFLRAASDASAEELAGPAAVKANGSILRDKTAGEVRAWALREMQTRWDRAGRKDWIKIYYGDASPQVASEPDPKKQEQSNMFSILISIFAKPMLSMVEKYILAAVMFAVGKGWIAGDAGVIAGAIYTIVSGVFTGMTQTQNAKVTDINETTNGVRVVETAAAKRASIPAATEIIPDPPGSR